MTSAHPWGRGHGAGCLLPCWHSAGCMPALDTFRWDNVCGCSGCGYYDTCAHTAVGCSAGVAACIMHLGNKSDCHYDNFNLTDKHTASRASSSCTYAYFPGPGVCAFPSAGTRLTCAYALCSCDPHVHTMSMSLQEAVHSINETLRMAQQSADHPTLQHTLAVLCGLLADAPCTAPELPEAGAHASLLPLRCGAHHMQLLRLLRRWEGQG